MRTVAEQTAHRHPAPIRERGRSPHPVWRGTGPVVAHALRPSAVQTRLTIGASDDVYEREANQVATAIMRMPQPSVQRTCSCGGSCAECRHNEPDREGMLQRKSTTDPARRREATPEVDRVLQSPGQPLPAATRAFMEPRFGHDFSDVRIHTGPAAAQSARQMQAMAYTVGHDIAFAPHQYAPSTSAGRSLLAHELTHVVQQGGSLAARVQRARMPCYSEKKVKFYTVSLPGATRPPGSDIEFANSVLCQCGIELQSVGGESWQTNVLDQDDPRGTLNEFSDMNHPTDEEKALMAHRPGGDVVHLYYVPKMSAGSRGEALLRGACLPCVDSIVVSDSAAQDTLAHEFGHILMTHGEHHPDPDNLLASGQIRNVGVAELEKQQCDQMQLP